MERLNKIASNIDPCGIALVSQDSACNVVLILTNKKNISRKKICSLQKGTLKRAAKLWPKLIFVFAAKVGWNTTSIFKFHFSWKIYPLAHQNNYLHIEKQNCFLKSVFIWSTFFWKTKEDSHRPKHTTIFLRTFYMQHFCFSLGLA